MPERDFGNSRRHNLISNECWFCGADVEHSTVPCQASGLVERSDTVALRRF